VLVPYSTYQLVAAPFGSTVPVTVAVVPATAVTGPVMTVGAEAAEAPRTAPGTTTARVATTRAPRRLPELNVFTCRRPVPSGC